jgi:hypothetical protein
VVFWRFLFGDIVLEILLWRYCFGDSFVEIIIMISRIPGPLSFFRELSGIFFFGNLVTHNDINIEHVFSQKKEQDLHSFLSTFLNTFLGTKKLQQF